MELQGCVVILFSFCSTVAAPRYTPTSDMGEFHFHLILAGVSFSLRISLPCAASLRGKDWPRWGNNIDLKT